MERGLHRFLHLATVLALAGTGAGASLFGAQPGPGLCLRVPAGGNFGLADLIKRAPYQKWGVLASEVSQ